MFKVKEVVYNSSVRGGGEGAGKPPFMAITPLKRTKMAWIEEVKLRKIIHLRAEPIGEEEVSHSFLLHRIEGLSGLRLSLLDRECVEALLEKYAQGLPDLSPGKRAELAADGTRIIGLAVKYNVAQ